MYQNNLKACVQEPFAIFSRFISESNSFTEKDLCDDQNFRVIDLLDDGYLVAQDLVEMMENKRDLYRQLSKNYASFCTRCSQRIHRQSTLSSYHTTKRAQLDTVSAVKKLVAVEEQRVHNIQTVIHTFRKAIDDMYVTTRFTNQRHHYRTKELKRQFKEANSSFMNCTILLEHLTSSLHKARENLARVDDALEILSHDSTKSNKKRAALVTKQSDRVACIQKTVKQIKLLKNKRDQEEILWRQKAKLIFDECQKEEVKRLDLMKKTLLDFTQAMQIKDQQTVDHIYLTLAKEIQTKQNSKTDVEWWAKVYGAMEEEEVLENDEIDSSGYEQDDDTV